jgi:hypothetical protein
MMGVIMPSTGLSLVMMALGGLLAAADRRYRLTAKAARAARLAGQGAAS